MQFLLILVADMLKFFLHLVIEIFGSEYLKKERIGQSEIVRIDARREIISTFKKQTRSLPIYFFVETTLVRGFE